MQDGAHDGAQTAPPSARPGRLRRRSEFLAASGGKRFHTERMSVQTRLRAPDEVRDGAPVEGLQVGFTITKRVGHATERNRIRRRLRRAIEQAADGVTAPPVDLVVIARRPALSIGFETLVEDLRRALSVARKLKPARPNDSAASSGAASSGATRDRTAHPSRRRGSGRTASPNATTTPHGTTDG